MYNYSITAGLGASNKLIQSSLEFTSHLVKRSTLANLLFHYCKMFNFKNVFTDTYTYITYCRDQSRQFFSFESRRLLTNVKI
jgi:hypothetical protein